MGSQNLLQPNFQTSGYTANGGGPADGAMVSIPKGDDIRTRHSAEYAFGYSELRRFGGMCVIADASETELEMSLLGLKRP